MAAACQLLVMAVLVAMTSCQLRPRGDDWNEDRVPRTKNIGSSMCEVKVLPSEYIIRAPRNFTQLYNDSACKKGQCLRSCKVPKLVDCNQGPECVLATSNSQQMKNDGFKLSLKLLEVTFSEVFEVETVKIHYTCISTNNLQLRVIINFSGRGKQRIRIECRNHDHRNILSIKYKPRQSRKIVPGDRIEIRIKFQPRITLHLVTNEDAEEGEDRSRMCDTTVISSCVQGEGGQGSVVAEAVAGTLAGVLVIFIAVAIVCLTVAVCVYNQRRRKAVGDTAKERDGGLANPAYTTTKLGQAVETGNKFTNPTYSPSAIGNGTSKLQHHNTPSNPMRTADEDPLYAVLEDPAPIASSSTVIQPRAYEEIDAPSPNTTPLFIITDKDNRDELALQSHDCNLPQPASNADPPPTTGQPHCDSFTLEDTYSQLDRELPNPSYSHLFRDPQNRKGEGEGDVVAGSSYSHLLHQPGGGVREQQRETGITTQHTYSHLICDGGGRGMTQNGANESAYFHMTDCHT